MNSREFIPFRFWRQKMRRVLASGGFFASHRVEAMQVAKDTHADSFRI
jgi:hypothetical protein